MKTSVQPGHGLTLTAPSGGVVSGSAYLIGSLLVVAAETVAQTLPFDAVVVGVLDLPKPAAEAWTEGLALYWDDGNGVVTLDDNAAANPLIGVAAGPITAIRLTLATDADPSDLLIDGLTLQVLDYAQLATDNAVVTVTIAGVAHALVEGTDWTAATGDDETATSLASAIDALPGVSATATTDTVTVVQGTGVGDLDSAVGRVRLDGVAR